MNWTKFFFGGLILFNLFVIANDIFVSPGSSSVYLSSLVLLLLAAILVLYFFRESVIVIAWNAGLISFFLLVVNGAFFFKAVEHPAILTWKIVDQSNLASVVFLKESPFVKFKANSKITSQGARGKDFTYQWITDDFGFKNFSSTKDDRDIDFIALGDSFTEAMGTAIEDTWPSQMQKISSTEVYNAGVQGYAATQYLGAYELLSEKISHEGIIIGAFPTTYTREKKFTSKSLKIMQEGTGGIASIVGASSKQVSFLPSFISASKRAILSNMITSTINSNPEIISELPDSTSQYRDEIPQNVISRVELQKLPSWKSYVSALTQLSEKALTDDKRVILIQFPHRHEIYFNALDMGLSDIYQTQYYVELDSLKSNLPANVEILDMLPFIKSEYEKMDTNIYFELDGHMNEKGNRLVADFISNYLSQ